MSNIRERHSLTLSSNVWKLLELLKKAQSKSISLLLEEAVWEMVKSKGYNTTYFEIMSNSEEVSKEENKELTNILDRLTQDDLRVVEEYEL